MGHLRKAIGISSQVIQLSKNEFYSQFHFSMEQSVIANIRLYSILTFVLENARNDYHCVKSVHIRSYSGPYFPAFELNTERYGVFLRIHSEFGKMRTRITPNTDTFHAVHPPARRCAKEIIVLKNCAKFKGIYLYQSLFFNKIASLRSATL